MDEMNTGAVATTGTIFGGQTAEQPAQAPELSGRHNDPQDRYPKPATVFGFAPEEPEAAAPEDAVQPEGPEDRPSYSCLILRARFLNLPCKLESISCN